MGCASPRWAAAPMARPPRSASRGGRVLGRRLPAHLQRQDPRRRPPGRGLVGPRAPPRGDGAARLHAIQPERHQRIHDAQRGQRHRGRHAAVLGDDRRHELQHGHHRDQRHHPVRDDDRCQPGGERRPAERQLPKPDALLLLGRPPDRGRQHPVRDGRCEPEPHVHRRLPGEPSRQLGGQARRTSSASHR